MVLRILLMVSLLFCGSCATSPGQKTAVGAVVGAGIGAGLGAIIGQKTGGSKGQGAAIGAVLGGALGGTYGNRLDKQAKELAAIAETRRTENGIITKLQSDILFASGKDNLKSEAQNSLNQIADIIKKYPEDRLKVIGHTDSDGSESLNNTLSLKRAESVRQQLVKAGVPQEHINIIGLGESQPIAANTDANGKQLNRRVEIEISVDEKAIPKK
jgi:outer membrane protein OmpA-like peptidoglycan-associated protein